MNFAVVEFKLWGLAVEFDASTVAVQPWLPFELSYKDQQSMHKSHAGSGSTLLELRTKTLFSQDPKALRCRSFIFA